jgi:hypothetical protein
MLKIKLKIKPKIHLKVYKKPSEITGKIAGGIAGGKPRDTGNSWAVDTEKCPKCGSRLRSNGEKLWCSYVKCSFFSVINDVK